MVLSRLDSTIAYDETYQLNPDDVGKSTNKYQTTINSIPIIIAVGRGTVLKTITNYPIYLITKSNRAIQIGKFEAKNVVNPNSYISPQNMKNPLIYGSFVSAQLLEKMRLVPKSASAYVPIEKLADKPENLSKIAYPVTQKQRQMGPIVIPENRKPLFVADPTLNHDALGFVETRQNAIDIQRDFKPSGTNIFWVQNYMKNPYFTLVSIVGDGDCFFTSTVSAFSRIGQVTTVEKLRSAVAKNLTDAEFNSYKSHAIEFKNSVNDARAKYNALFNLYKIPMAKLKTGETSQEEYSRMRTELMQYKSEYETAKLYYGDYERFDVPTIEKMRQMMRLQTYWADLLTIEKMEKLLNVIYIIFSKDAYESTDMSSVIMCRGAHTSGGDIFPEYYIMLEFAGANINQGHYQLIGYREQHIFSFDHLPFDVKKRIVDTCMVSSGGVYNQIPEFRQFKENLYSAVTVAPKSSAQPVPYITDNESQKNLFVYFSQSADKSPGKGKGEILFAPTESLKFTELSQCPDWRKKMDEYWVQPFELEGKTWSSVANFYQGAKYRGMPEFRNEFSIESNSDLSKNPILAKKIENMLTYTDSISGRTFTDIKIDPIFKANAKTEKRKAQYAKFSQNPDLLKCLVATKDATLAFYRRDRAPDPDTTLMAVRDELSTRS